MVTSPITGGSSAAPARSPTQGLAANFDNFLKLLTTQLQKQDPLAPMDATNFTSQLVEFASVEQAIQTNTRLADLSKLIAANSTTSAMGMLGREVTAATDKVALAGEGEVSSATDWPSRRRKSGSPSATGKAESAAPPSAAPARARTWPVGTAPTPPAAACQRASTA
jgi:flagellar basal-body rod modification protein FlgD